MQSQLYFSSVLFEQYDALNTLPAKFERMLKRIGKDIDVKDKVTVIKMHVGRGIGFSTIHPLFVQMLVQKLKEWGAKPYICDQEVDGARNRGYTEEFLGCPIVKACAWTNKYAYERAVDFKSFQHVDVAGYIHDADFMIDLSHVKGHGSCGYGGAVKNIAMGCVTDRTRREIHALEGGITWNEDLCTHCGLCIKSCNHDANHFNKQGKYRMNYHHCTVCQHCTKVCPTGALTMDAAQYNDFQKGMALCTSEVLQTFKEKHVYYINFLTNITAVCDCWGMTTPNVVPDIGIIAGSDIVAIEKACLDAIKLENLLPDGLPSGQELGQQGHLFERLHGRNPFVQLDELVALGLGQMAYTLNEIQ